MALWFDTVCSNCGQAREFVSDCMALQLDDGSLSLLPHPAESRFCEQHGLTLYQASQRNRLFEQDYYLCRRCGGLTNTIRRARRQSPPIGEPGPWFLLKLAIVVTVVGVPIALWAGRGDLALYFVILLVLSPLMDLNERRKHRRQRQREGRPVLPTPDAPGRTTVPEPQPPGPCCEDPELVPVSKLASADPVPCAACGEGVLKVVGGGIS